MKNRILKNWAGGLMVILLTTILFPAPEAKAENPFGVSFQVFYDELAPFGDWVMDARHGYIWLPYAEQGFHPYGSNGHWAMTEYGNTWVSYYDWGWAPFHYGRWYFDNFYQSWAWVPGYDWGPAWVNWRTGGGYYGWAPLAPGFGINVGMNIPSFYFVFIPRNRIYHHYAHRYYAPYRQRVRIYNNTTIINNTVVYNNYQYVAGPNRREIERVTRRAVPVYEVRATDRAGRAAVSRNSISLYRPDLQNSRGRTVEARPSRVLEAEQARNSRSQSAGRSAANPSRSTIDSRDSRTIQRNSVQSPSNERTRSFEGRPYQEGQSRSTTPDRESQIRQAQPANRNNIPSTSGRTDRGQYRAPQTRSTGPQQIQRKPEVHTADPRRRSGHEVSSPASGQTRQPRIQSTPSRSSSPKLNGTPSHNTNPRVNTAPQERSNTVQRGSTPELKRSSAPTRSSSGRGNRGN